jgi:methylated-DNA-protein-cysteine methyltransferase-like protein
MPAPARHTDNAREPESNRGRIYTVISLIPAGHVATYGQIAALSALPGQARQVGYALAALPDDSPVSWHRVVNARGEISVRARTESIGRQRLRLESEGVEFDAAGRVPLQQFLWRP